MNKPNRLKISGEFKSHEEYSTKSGVKILKQQCLSYKEHNYIR